MANIKQYLLLKILALYGGALLIGMVLVSVPASSIYLMSLHGLTDQQYGSVFLGQLVFAIAGALLAGPAVKRLSLKFMFAVALCCFFVSQACLAWSNFTDSTKALWLIKVSLSFFGFGFGFGGGPLNGIVPLLFPKRVNSAITCIHMMAGLGLATGPLYFRAFEASGHWVYAPVLLSLIALFLLFIHLVFNEKDKDATDSNNELEKPGKSAYFWLIVLIAFLYALVEGVFSNWAIIFVHQSKGFSLGVAATALSGFWAGLTIGRLLTTFLVIKVKAFFIWLSSPVLMVIALWLLPHVSSENQAIYGFVFSGFAVAAFFPLMVSVAAAPFPRSVSWIASMLTASLMCGVGLGAYVIGGILDKVSMEAVYQYALSLPVIIIVLMLLSLRFKPRLAD